MTETNETPDLGLDAITRDDLLQALTGFYLSVSYRGYGYTGQIDDTAEVAGALYATLSRIAAERRPDIPAEEKSPGQAACEAFWAYLGTGPTGQSPSAAWDWARSQGTQGAWIAASQAAAEATERSRRSQPEAAGTETTDA
jgi:hypothetical protein